MSNRMKNRLRNLAVVVTVLGTCGVAAAIAADGGAAGSPEHAPWHSGNYWGAGVQLALPNSDFGDNFSTGYGLQAMFDYPLIPLIDVSGSLGWTRFPAEGDREAASVWGLALGCRFALGAFFMNGEVGHFSHVDEWSFIPGLGLRYDHWEGALRFKAVGDATWTGFRVGYYF